MNGWVPIPSAAIAAVTASVGRPGRGALIDLYDVADRTRYAPRPFTEETLSSEWGVSRGDVRAILAALVSVGCLTVERSTPGRKRKSVLVVLRGNQTGNQTRNQTGEPAERDRGNPEPDAEPDGEPACAVEPPRGAEQTQIQTSVGESVDRAHPSAPVGGDLMADPSALRSVLTDRHAQALGDLLEHAQRSTPGHAFDPADVRALRGALGRWTVDDLRLVWDHFQAGEGSAALAVTSGWSRSWAAIAKTDRLAGRVRDARAWEAKGRPNATGPPARAAPPDPMDAHLARRLTPRPTKDQEHG